MTTTTEQCTIDVDESLSPIEIQFNNILNTLSQFKTQITTISTQLRSLEKNIKREVKQHKKEVIKKQQHKGSRKPSGFAAASTISIELCDFMGKEHGSSIARTDVTKFICNYIRLNSFECRKQVRRPSIFISNVNTFLCLPYCRRNYCPMKKKAKLKI